MIAANAALANSYDYLQAALSVLMVVSAVWPVVDLVRRVHRQQQIVLRNSFLKKLTEARQPEQPVAKEMA